MKKFLNNKGFTMVELIIVIAIIAVLAAVLAPQYLRFVEDAKESTDVDKANQIESTINILIAAGDIAVPAVTTTDGTKVITWTVGTGVISAGTGATTALTEAEIDAIYAQLNVSATSASKDVSALKTESANASATSAVTWTIRNSADGKITVSTSNDYKAWAD